MVLLGQYPSALGSTKAIQFQTPAKKITVSSDFGTSLKWWELEISKKPYSWYRSEVGLRMAENILSWQDKGTGWPLMNTVQEPFNGEKSRVGPWGKQAALVKATVNELRFLARAYTAVEDERYREAVLGGLDFILDAQQQAGGWPKSVSQKTDYYQLATFNDEVIPDLMTLLYEVSNSSDFRMIGEDHLQRVKEAYAKGLDFILKSQIEADGTLTAWAQQYDPVTIEPKPARAFEPAAISGGESAGVLHFLMGIRNPSAAVIRAVNAGAQWYREVQIDGLEVVRTEDDLVVKTNLDATPLWARFYEIDTNRPIFAGRDGVIRYNVSEIEAERRRGYAWYNTNGVKVLQRYAAWKHERKWDDFPPTNIDEANVRDYSLPDPLDIGSRRLMNSSSDWEKYCRPAVMKLFETHQHGRMPVTPVVVENEILEQDVPGMNGRSRRTQVRIGFPEHPEVSPIRLLINVPADAKGPVPTLLHISFTPNVLLFNEAGIDEGMAWNGRMQMQIPDRDALLLRDVHPERFIERGYGVATVYYGDIEPDFDHGGKYGVRSLFPASGARASDDWGSLGAWSWGLSRIVDYLQTDPAVDGKKIALSGVSRLGKAVIWAGAQDERIAMVIPMLSGEGGASISRRNFGETIADLTNPVRYDYWFAPRYQEYAGKADELPVDGHMLLALIAPRPVLQIVGNTDTWSDPMGEWVSAKAATPVYALYGKKGIEKEAELQAGQPILQDMGFFMHDGGHRVLPEDFDAILDFMDHHFGQH